jgi:hypothetical protein
MSGERGETSILGLLVAMLLFAIVLGATLTTFEGGATASRQATPSTVSASPCGTSRAPAPTTAPR